MQAREACLALPNLNELITAEPKSDGRGVDLILHGRPAQILPLANDRPDLRPGGRLASAVAGARSATDHGFSAPEGSCLFEMVAGTGFEPVTFRL